MKIATIDDSKAVRIIVKKAFEPYEVEIHEAANGQEGLELVGKLKPDLILLDVTMPVMDGVEMLTKLKQDGNLKQIPVIMLTAEAGKENVMKIAKIGVRDYIIKPFENDNLIQKVKRVVELKEKAVAVSRPKTIEDSCEIMVVDDKPAIIDQIKQGFEAKKWLVRGAGKLSEAVEECNKLVPDVILISLGLPDNQGLELFRSLRSGSTTKSVPVFGMAIKTATKEIQDAQQAGMNGIVYKPLDLGEIESKVIKVLKLDTSSRYFKQDGSALLVTVGEQYRGAFDEVMGYLNEQVSRAVESGLGKAVIDLSEMKTVDIDLVKFLLEAMKVCKDLSLECVLVAKGESVSQYKGFAEAAGWVFSGTVEEAKKSGKAVVV